MHPVLEILSERGFFQQCSDVEGLSKTLDRKPVVFYVGCDPTGPSLHIGHMVPFFAFRHLRMAGQTGIALLGEGTARIGDPSGKSEMRKMMSYETINDNSRSMMAQLNQFIEFDGKTAIMDNNRVWLENLNYIEFLREIGVHFSVNRMLSFESYRRRMETGLSFIEFNYQLLQSYDFLQLYRRHGCTLQIGGNDQWGNIVAGIELIRRVEGVETFGLTFPLVETSDGKKMGKTEKGALFLNPNMTSVFDFFQYWRNITDTDVEKFLLMFTFLPVEECKKFGSLQGEECNYAKERLAWEVTSLIHGKEEADKALNAAKAAFGGKGNLEDIPTKHLKKDIFTNGVGVLDLFLLSSLVGSKSEARRLVQQGGAVIKDKKIDDEKMIIDEKWLDENNSVILRAGKKHCSRVIADS